MKTKLTLAFLFVSFCLFAQNADDFDRLHGEKLEKTLYLFFDGDKFSYKSKFSEADEYPLEIPKELINFQIGNDKRNTLQIFLEFYNPLTYKVTSTATESDDENFKALSDFMANLSSNVGDFKEVTSTAENQKFSFSVVKSNNKGVITISKSKFDDVVQNIYSMYDKSPFLNDWVIQFKLGITNKSKAFLNTSGVIKINEVVNLSLIHI